MKNYPFYLSYSSKDLEFARIFTQIMEEKGYSVYNPMTCTEPGLAYAAAIVGAISSCDYFIVLISDDAMGSSHILNEIAVAVERRKTILPIFLDRLDLSEEFNYYIGRLNRIYAPDKSKSGIADVVDKIDISYGSQMKRAALYEKLSEYQKIKNKNREAETLCELIKLIVSEYHNTAKKDDKLARELLRIYEVLHGFYGGYDQETRALAIKIMETMQAARILYSDKTRQLTVLDAVLALNIIYLEYEIATECVDIRTGGDVHQPFSNETLIRSQEKYLEIYEKYCTKTGEPIRKSDSLSKEDLNLIKGTPARIYAYRLACDEKRDASREKTDAPKVEKPEGDDEILHSIADFMQKGNELFNLLHQKGVAGDFLKCLLTSYERLKNYCMIVGATKVAADCVEKIAEIRQELASETASEVSNEKAENGIKSLLGFTTEASGEYDVFISFKSEDNDLAKMVYQFCKKNMIEAFWSKVSLPEMSKSDYGDAIDSALDSSKHFVLVLSDLNYLESDWIKYEMSTFADEIREGRKEGANFVILATDKVYRELIESNKKVLPIKYRWCQILKLSEFEETLLSYLK